MKIRSRLLIGIMTLLLSSCATKKQNAFNFGGDRDYPVNEVVISTPEDKSETLENIEPDSLAETVISVKEKKISNNNIAHRIAEKKATKLVKKQLKETEISKGHTQNLSKKKATNNKTGRNNLEWWKVLLLIIGGIIVIGIISLYMGGETLEDVFLGWIM